MPPLIRYRASGSALGTNPVYRPIHPAPDYKVNAGTLGMGLIYALISVTLARRSTEF
jgi:hypothetical protein